MSPNINYNDSVSSEKTSDDSATLREIKSSKNNKEKIMVVVRIRPIMFKKNFKSNVFAVNNKTIILEEQKSFFDSFSPSERKPKVYSNKDKFIFDAVFAEDASQEDIYNFTTKYLVNEVISGYNGTVFVYGATGSGKTYTLMAMNYENDHTVNFPKCGIIIQAFRDLFSAIERQKKHYAVSLSYMEIYNENIRDLFKNNDSSFLELRENSNNTHIIGLNELVVTSAQQAINLLKKGNEIRTVRSTGANFVSSRSHAILIIILRQTYQQEKFNGFFKTITKQSKLLFVDLAGSERAQRTKNKGKKLQEGSHINKSLLALGKCISALSKGTNISHINFRDSKLTRLLREPLTGDYHTIMIAQVNPSMEYKDETKNTLIYASKVMGISKKIMQHTLQTSNNYPGYQNLVVELRNEVARLKNKINKGTASVSSASKNPAIKKLKEDIISTFEEQITLRRQLLDVDNHILFLNKEAEKQNQLINQWLSKNNKLYRWKFLSTEQNSIIIDNSSDINEVESALNSIEKEQESSLKLRVEISEKLEDVKRKAALLENELHNLDTEAEKEMLTLLCKVHELEADKLSLVGERLLDAYELLRSTELLNRYHKQQEISDDIITRQRQLIEEEGILMPTDLQKLYQLYQEEIQTTIFQNIKEIRNPEQLNLPSIKNLNKITDNNEMRKLQSKVFSFSSSDSNESDENKPYHDKSNVVLPKLLSASVIERNNSERSSPIPAPVLFPPITF